MTNLIHQHKVGSTNKTNQHKVDMANLKHQHQVDKKHLTNQDQVDINRGESNNRCRGRMRNTTHKVYMQNLTNQHQVDMTICNKPIQGEHMNTSQKQVEKANGKSTQGGQDQFEKSLEDGQHKSEESTPGAEQHQKHKHHVDRNNLQNQDQVDRKQ